MKFPLLSVICLDADASVQIDSQAETRRTNRFMFVSSFDLNDNEEIKDESFFGNLRSRSAAEMKLPVTSSISPVPDTRFCFGHRYCDKQDSSGYSHPN